MGGVSPQRYDLTPKVLSIMIPAVRARDWSGAQHLADVDLALGPFVINRARLLQAETGRILSFHLGPGAPRVEFLDPELSALARDAASDAYDKFRRS